MTKLSSDISILDKLLQSVFIVAVILRTTVSFEFLGEANIITRLLAFVCVCGGIYYFLLLLYRKLEISPLLCLLFGLCFYLIFVSFVQQWSIVALIGRALDIFILWGYLEYHRTQIIDSIKIIVFTYAICLIANLAIILLFPDGFWENENDLGTMTYYFLGGNYNAFGARMFSALLVTSLCCTKEKKYYVLYIILLAICIASLLLTGSKTSLVGLSLFSLYFFVFGSNQHMAISKISLIIVLIFELLFVFCEWNIGDFELARQFIENGLQKTTDFTYRTDLWHASLQRIAEHPLFGYGYVDNNWWAQNVSLEAIGPHNFILCELIYGGVVYVGLWTVLGVYVFRQAKNSQQSSLIMVGLACLLLMMCFEVYGAFYLAFVLLLMYYLSLQEYDTKG